MALVAGVIAFSISAGSILYVSGSISTKTGTQFASRTIDAVAMKVYGVIITSSPGFTPHAMSAILSATDPLTQAIAYFDPQKSANSFSNISTVSPQSGLPQLPLLTTFVISSISV